MARDPRHTAANLLLGFAGGAAGLAAAVSTTTGHQGPFAAAGLAGLAAGAGLASRVLAVDAERDVSDWLAAELQPLLDDFFARQHAAVEEERAELERQEAGRYAEEDAARWQASSRYRDREFAHDG